MPVGTTAGYSGSPGAGVAGGEASLNALAGQRPPISGVPNEDSWGIIKITDIQSIGSDGVLHSVYNHLVSPYELTAMFWGVHDFYLNQVSAGSGLPGGGQIIDGTGLRVDIYSDLTKDFDQTGGPGARGSVSTYPTVTDGTLELSLLSTPGFINANGTFGGSATEFESNTSNVGYAALNVIGGSASTRPQFDTNGIGFSGTSGTGFTPGLVTSAADIWFSFTSTPGTNGWDINSNDPMLANISAIPDGGSSVLMMIAGLACLGAAHLRRKQKA
jgi:hypothetical protein